MWSHFITCLLQVCLQVATVVSPVVQNSSPEGNVPEEAVLGKMRISVQFCCLLDFVVLVGVWGIFFLLVFS